MTTNKYNEHVKTDQLILCKINIKIQCYVTLDYFTLTDCLGTEDRNGFDFLWRIMDLGQSSMCHTLNLDRRQTSPGHTHVFLLQFWICVALNVPPKNNLWTLS